MSVFLKNWNECNNDNWNLLLFSFVLTNSLYTRVSTIFQSLYSRFTVKNIENIFISNSSPQSVV